MIDADLLVILGCPLEDSRPPLEVKGDYLVCTSCGYGFPLKDGIPHLLPEDGIAPDQLKEMIG